MCFFFHYLILFDGENGLIEIFETNVIVIIIIIIDMSKELFKFKLIVKFEFSIISWDLFFIIIVYKIIIKMIVFFSTFSEIFSLEFIEIMKT